MRTSAFISLILFITTQFQPVRVGAWTVDLTATGNSQIFNLQFGGDPAATDGYDVGLDTPVIPEGGVYAVFFEIAGKQSFLSRDIRGWISPYDTPIRWTLRIINAGTATTTFTWDPAQLPTEGRFFLSGAQAVDMHKQNQAVYSGDQNITLNYVPNVTVTYTFTLPGWYLICLPVDPLDNRVFQVFPDALGKVAYAWNTVTGGYTAVTELTVGEGFWLAIPVSDRTVQVTGMAIRGYNRHLTVGWHLIGSVYEGADFSNPNDTPDNSVLIPAYGWIPPMGPYYAVDVAMKYYLNQTEGFWAAVQQECDLTVGFAGKGVAPKPSSVSVEQYEDFTKKYGSTPPPPPFMTSVEQPTGRVPAEFKVEPVFPNPFNPETTISWSLPAAGPATVRVFDLRGREICSLLEGWLEVGPHRTVWDGRDKEGRSVPSGIYLIRISSGTSRATVKATLIR